MSVYIRGMEMPNNCRDCPLEDAYEGYNCRIVEKSANWGLEGRPSWCPLAPVPPHGRLIDADALMLKIKDYIEEYDDLDENGYHNLKWCAMKEVEMAIEDAPTIISSAEMI